MSKKIHRYSVNLSIETIRVLRELMVDHIAATDSTDDKFYKDYVKTIPSLDKAILKHKKKEIENGRHETKDER